MIGIVNRLKVGYKDRQFTRWGTIKRGKNVNVILSPKTQNNLFFKLSLTKHN